jgi:hypothetical protein
MHIVDQLTPFTCDLACIESLTTDFKMPITQAQLLVRYKKQLIADVRDYGDFGATSTGLLKVIWEDLGFTGSWFRDHRQAEVREAVFKPLQMHQSIFLVADYQKNGRHCMRYAGLKDDDTVYAMVPAFGLKPSFVEELSFQNLIAWDYSFAVISK